MSEYLIGIIIGFLVLNLVFWNVRQWEKRGGMA